MDYEKFEIKWKKLKRKCIWTHRVCIDVYKELGNWEYEELLMARSLCQSQMPMRSVWAETIPVIAILISVGSIWLSIDSMILNYGNYEINWPLDTKWVDSLFTGFGSFALAAFILWLICACKTVLCHKYKRLCAMCESHIERLEHCN